MNPKFIEGVKVIGGLLGIATFVVFLLFCVFMLGFKTGIDVEEKACVAERSK